MSIRRSLLAFLLLAAPLALGSASCGGRSIIAAEPDGGAPDSGPDGGSPDGGSPDGGSPDGGSPDGGSPDGGSPDGGSPDGGSPDGGSPDGGSPDGGCAHACGTACVPESATSCGANCDVCGATNGYTPACVNHSCTQTCDTSSHHVCGITAPVCAADDDASKCGSLCLGCGPLVISGTRTCTGGNTCGVTCDSGYHYCSSFTGLFPCKDDTSPNSCGTRCDPCAAPPTANAHTTCTGAACGWECDSGYHRCGNTCEAISPASCGATCKTCAAPTDPNAVATCDGSGTCGIACKAGYHSCGGTCVVEDKNSCGATCAFCDAPPTNATEQCLNHACTYVCNAPQLKCSSGCCTAQSVWAGGNQTCAVVAGGELRCFGELANVSGTSVPLPETPAAGPYVAAAMGNSIGQGTTTRCGLTSNNHVVCFDGSANGTLVASNITRLTAGEAHYCGLTSAGGIKCGGYGGYGQLGNGATASATTPVDVIGFSSGAASVAAHANQTCAVTTGGGAQCWGHNDSGQLGDGSKADRSQPVNVSGLTSLVSAIAVGDEHACALLTNDSIKCWGDNTYGQLGDGTTGASLVPVTVANLGGTPTAVSAGDYFTCALLSDGTVKCWGYNGYGQVGDNDSVSYHVYTPATVANVSGATSLVSGFWHSCAQTANGIWCWGWNAGGQCGNGVQLTGYSIDEYSAVQVVGR